MSALPCLFASASVAAFFAPVDEKGFEPRSVTVDPGDTVAFENVDDEAHWPASDDHPNHEEYPEFDPRKPVQPITDWSFTFERAGQWKYHDHINPYLTGEVVVRDEGDRAGYGGFLSSVRAFLRRRLRDGDLGPRRQT